MEADEFINVDEFNPPVVTHRDSNEVEGTVIHQVDDDRANKELESQSQSISGNIFILLKRRRSIYCIDLYHKNEIFFYIIKMRCFGLVFFIHF